ncbi:MAG: glycosyltransferase [Nitrospira sp.]|nr:glycosyltransferase [Nitrospira sp.]
MNRVAIDPAVHCIQYLPNVSLEDGGVVRFVLDICGVLAAHGMRVTLVTQDATAAPTDWIGRDNKPGVLLLEQRALPAGLLTAKSLESIERLIDNNTVMHLHIPWVLSNFQLARLARRRSVPYVVTPHGSLDTWSMSQKQIKKEIFWLLFGRVHYENAAFVHYTAASEQDQASRYVNKAAAKIIPCLFDCESFKEVPDKKLALEKFSAISEDKPNILFLSRLHPKKGVDILVDAARILQGKVEFNILIAGPEDAAAQGYARKLRKTVEDYGLLDQVHFIGMVQGQEKLSLYGLADLFVLPTHQENFGFVLVESMACGTPVITSFGVDIWREIQEGGASIVNNIAEEVAVKIESLLKDLPALKALGGQSRKWVFQALAADRIASEYFSMYVQALQTSQVRR